MSSLCSPLPLAGEGPGVRVSGKGSDLRPETVTAYRERRARKLPEKPAYAAVTGSRFPLPNIRRNTPAIFANGRHSTMSSNRL